MCKELKINATYLRGSLQIESRKLAWNAQSKVGSLKNANHKAGKKTFEYRKGNCASLIIIALFFQVEVKRRSLPRNWTGRQTQRSDPRIT